MFTYHPLPHQLILSKCPCPKCSIDCLCFFLDLTENTKQPDPNAIFVVSASDETQLCVMLVHWLRKKGFDATCVETGNMEQGSSPFQYVERWCKNASMVIVVCSPKFKEVVSDEINTTHLNCESDLLS